MNIKNVVILLFLFASPVFAQEKPDNPLPKAPVKEQVVDKKFLALKSISASLGVIDVRTFRDCMQKYPPIHNIHTTDGVLYGASTGCIEKNPLLGRYPSTARQVATGTIIHGGITYLSYQLKKNHKWYWWMPEVALIAAHSYGIYSNTTTIPYGYKGGRKHT